jgi:hypothetical protein
MSKFGHVADGRLRAILEEGSESPDDLVYALQQTTGAVGADEEDEDVSYETFNRRQDALEAAEAAWHDDRDATEAIASLQRCWSD